ncbi:hypothetical protein [Streptomyces jumonjinensis]|uniref:Uncharacterized protein n=1 Tax=Streptomyces jumonjinensis TaxID=1945 RepID=A0A646KKY2_STRJU|nr:hypothetical protein [Streptomyces jumonjinensis]MQT02893.1 hypothetical protein [Streptomyces jumonjinensis]
MNNEERAEWAAIALNAYMDEAPRTLVPIPNDSERVRLGVVAAEAMARATRSDSADHVVNDYLSAELIIGDLIVYLFHMVDDKVTPDQIIAAAEEMRAPYPVTLTALCTVAAADAGYPAAMLAALMEAAAHFGCDVSETTAQAKDFYEEEKAEEEAEQDA